MGYSILGSCTAIEGKAGLRVQGCVWSVVGSVGLRSVTGVWFCKLWSVKLKGVYIIQWCSGASFGPCF